MAATKADLMSAIRTKLAAAGRPSTHFNLLQTDLDPVCDGIITYLNANYASGGAALTDGDKGDVTVSASGATWTIDSKAVTLAKIADIATARILGRNSGGSGVTEELTGTTVTALLDAVTAGAKGLAPASGGGTVNFLRADATWATPPDTDTNTNPYQSVMTAAVPTGKGAFAMTNNTSYGVYLGRAPFAASSVVVNWQMTGAGTGAITWAEAGIATGTMTWGGNPDLSLIGYTDISGAISVALKSTTITCTVAAGDRLWFMLGFQRATSAPSVASYTTDAGPYGGSVSLAATRLSTMAVPTTFTAIANHVPYGVVLF